jgi:hypothetical protein
VKYIESFKLSRCQKGIAIIARPAGMQVCKENLKLPGRIKRQTIRKRVKYNRAQRGQNHHDQ